MTMPLPGSMAIGHVRSIVACGLWTLPMSGTVIATFSGVMPRASQSTARVTGVVSWAQLPTQISRLALVDPHLDLALQLAPGVIGDHHPNPQWSHHPLAQRDFLGIASLLALPTRKGGGQNDRHMLVGRRLGQCGAGWLPGGINAQGKSRAQRANRKLPRGKASSSACCLSFLQILRCGRSE